MALRPGTHVGPYEILATAGAGGMGEVYRARDARLKRDVAIKVLPDHGWADADRLARLEREAQLLAARNHPCIAQIYGLEAHQTTRALVMEFVEGQTLAERIAFDERLMAAQIELPASSEGPHVGAPSPLFATHVGGPSSACRASSTSWLPTVSAF